MKNLEIRAAAQEADLKLWQIAEAMGIRDTDLSKMLRYELPEDRKKQILAIIHRWKREEVSK